MKRRTNERKKLGIFLLGFGAFIALCGWSMFGQGKQGSYETQLWKEVEAEILTSERKTVSMHNPRSSGPSNITGWEPLIEYRYIFNGKTYENDRYTVSPSASQDYDEVTSIVQVHPVGSRTNVFVNPEKPSEAVLSREDQGSSTVLFVVGCVLVPLGIIMAAVGAAVWLRSRMPNGQRNE